MFWSPTHKKVVEYMEPAVRRAIQLKSDTDQECYAPSLKIPRMKDDEPMVLQSAKYIAENAAHVSIQRDGVLKTAMLVSTLTYFVLFLIFYFV